MDANTWDLIIKIAPLVISLITLSGVIPSIVAMKSIINKIEKEPQVMDANINKAVSDTLLNEAEYTKALQERMEPLQNEIKRYHEENLRYHNENMNLKEEIGIMKIKIIELEGTIIAQNNTIAQLRETNQSFNRRKKNR
jgi:hypothetical protein